MIRLAQIALGATLIWVAAPTGASAEPGGSYRQTCTQIDQRGPFLQALCRDTTGALRETRLDLRGCSRMTADVANINGQLACAGGDDRGRRPDGYGERREYGDGRHERNRYDQDRSDGDRYRERYGRRDYEDRRERRSRDSRDDDDDDRPSYRPYSRY